MTRWTLIGRIGWEWRWSRWLVGRPPLWRHADELIPIVELVEGGRFHYLVQVREWGILRLLLIHRRVVSRSFEPWPGDAPADLFEEDRWSVD